MSFKENFIWGCATAAYQIEGAANEDGRGQSIWDVFSHNKGNVFRDHTGDIACDHYHRYSEDIRIIADLHIPNYRFSVSWPRLLPEGIGQVNKKGIDFYNRLIDCLLENEIQPWLTLFHWDYPSALQSRGGWENPDSPKWFSEYVKLVADSFGDRVRNYITLNEPQCFIGYGNRWGTHAPGYRLPDSSVVPMSHHVLTSHGNAVSVLRELVPSCKIGYTTCGDAMIPIDNSPQAIEAARKAYFSVPSDASWSTCTSWWSDPVVLGYYPKDGLSSLEKYLPRGWEDDLPNISQKIDYYCQNIYSGKLICPANNEQGWDVVVPARGTSKTAIQWDVLPDSLYWGPKFLYERYHIPFIISENGMSAHDTVSLDGKVHDPNRIDYLNRYLLAYRKAAEEGVDAAGYFVWSLLDNFEWASGYSERFGLVYVDYDNNCCRKPKDSAEWYRNVIDTNGRSL